MCLPININWGYKKLENNNLWMSMSPQFVPDNFTVYDDKDALWEFIYNKLNYSANDAHTILHVFVTVIRNIHLDRSCDDSVKMLNVINISSVKRNVQTQTKRLHNVSSAQDVKKRDELVTKIQEQCALCCDAWCSDMDIKTAFYHRDAILWLDDQGTNGQYHSKKELADRV